MNNMVVSIGTHYVKYLIAVSAMRSYLIPGEVR